MEQIRLRKIQVVIHQKFIHAMKTRFGPLFLNRVKRDADFMTEAILQAGLVAQARDAGYLQFIARNAKGEEIELGDLLEPVSFEKEVEEVVEDAVEVVSETDEPLKELIETEED